MKVYKKKVFDYESVINLCFRITIILDIIYLLLNIHIYIYLKEDFYVMGWYGVVWFLTSVVYYVNRCSMDYKEKILKKISSSILKERESFKNNTDIKKSKYFILSIIYMIKYFSITPLISLYIFLINKFLHDKVGNLIVLLEWIPSVFFITITIVLLLELVHLLEQKIIAKIIVIIIFLVIVFGLFSTKDGIIEWVFLALVFMSAKDMLSPDIKYLNLSAEEANSVNEKNEDNTELKRRIVDLKYSLLLIIPSFYISLKFSEILINTKLYKKIVCFLLQNSENNFLRLIYEGEVKLFITFCITYTIHQKRSAIFRIIKQIIS